MLNFIPYFKNLVSKNINNEKGQGMVEYVLIIALIALIVIVIFPNVTTAITAAFQQIIDAL